MGRLIFWSVVFVQFVVSVVLTTRDFRAGILRAQCKARCLDKYGTPTSGNEDIYPLCRRSDCKGHSCRQCMVPCGAVNEMSEDCYAACENQTACMQSCAFILQEVERNHTDDDVSYDVISKPEVLCMDIPYSRHGDNICRTQVASLSLKWQTTLKMTENTHTYVISAREMDLETNVTKPWHVLQVVVSNFVRVYHLSCDTRYKFKVTAVTTSGIVGQSRDSDWIKTPSEPRILKPPRNLRVIDQPLHHQRPTAIISWDQLEDSGCYYRVYWMSRDWMSKGASEEEIRAPPEFKYRIPGLEFSSNYTVRLYSYDQDLIKGSEKDATISFVTPDCLQATHYNYTICPPEAADNISLAILTANSKQHDIEYVNITLSWDPPAHTNDGEEIVQYELEWRKEPPIHAAHLIVEHHGMLQLNATKYGPPEPSATINDLHNHNQYSVMLWARTRGGRGKVAKRIISLGLPVAKRKPEPLQANASTTDRNGLSTVELLAAILIPSVLSLTVVIAIWILAWKRRGKYRSRRHRAMEELNPIYDGIPPFSVPYDRQSGMAVDNYEIDFDSLTFQGVLGEGAFGKVMKAEFHKRLSDKGKKMGEIVAVKMLRDIFTTDEFRNFKKEVEAMKALESHPHLVGIIGCCLSGPKLCLVMDYCALGDLRNYLRKYREKLMYGSVSPQYDTRATLPSDNSETPLVSSDGRNSDDSKDDSTVEEISEAQLLSYARQITMGMEFLEQRKFVHRDLAARNILLADKRHIKISDFGLTRDVYETSMYQPTSARRLPYKWMALESLFNQEFTIKSDVWSFGVLLWEIVTLGGSPYPSVPLKDLYGLLNDGYRMERPENCSQSIYQIMLSCWHPCPGSRPCFSELKAQLEVLLAQTQTYIDLSIEVSGDYFRNDSTSGSRITTGSTIVSTDENQNPKTFKSRNCATEPSLAEIHDTPSDSEKEPSLEEQPDDLALDPGDDEVFLDNNSKTNVCPFNLDNKCKDVSQDENVVLQDNKKCRCVLCINRDSLKSNKSNSSSVQPLKNKTSFRDSLRCLIEKVGVTNKFVIPLQRKRSFSLTDMDKGVRCTIHL